MLDAQDYLTGLRRAVNSKTRRYLSEELEYVVYAMVVLSQAKRNETLLTADDGVQYYVSDYKLPETLAKKIAECSLIYFNDKARSLKAPCCLVKEIELPKKVDKVDSKLITPNHLENLLNEIKENSHLDWNLSNIDKKEYCISDLAGVYLDASSTKKVFVLLDGTSVSQEIVQSLGISTTVIQYDANFMRIQDELSKDEILFKLWK